MSHLKIYGNARTRANRAIWMAEELGLAYQVIPVDVAKGEARAPWFLAINPNGHVPAIDDEGFHLCESMAINLYLARKHGGPLAPRDAHEEGLAAQWSFWAVTEMEGPGLEVLFHRALLPPDKRDETKVAAALTTLEGPAGVLDAALARRDWLAADRFTVADLNTAAIAGYLRAAPEFLSRFPKLADWLGRCGARPAFRAMAAKRG